MKKGRMEIACFAQVHFVKIALLLNFLIALDNSLNIRLMLFGYFFWNLIKCVSFIIFLNFKMADR